MPANTVEIALLVKDAASAPLEALGEKVKELALAFAGFEGLKKLAENIGEAQAASAQLTAALQGVGTTSGQTQSSLIALAEEMSRTTTASSTLIKQAEAVLLTFGNVRDDAFQRTIKVANDLAARMGVDLVTATRQLAIALQQPGQNMRTLRAAGVDLTQGQQRVLEELNNTGRAAEAQSYLLARLETNLSGAAAAARNTLPGALTGLKNAFADLFEGTSKGTSSATEAINELGTALKDPGLKSAIDALIAGLAKIASAVIASVNGIVSLITGPVKGSAEDIGKTIDGLQKKLDDLEIKRTRAGAVRVAAPADQSISLGRGTSLTVQQIRDTIEELKKRQAELSQSQDSSAATTGTQNAELPHVDFLHEIVPNVQQQQVGNALQRVYQEWDDQTKTSAEKIAKEWDDAFYNIRELVSTGVITEEEANKRRDDVMKSIGLQEFDLNEIKSKYQVIKKETTELSNELISIWKGVGQSLQQSLSDAIYSGSFQIKSLVDVARRAFADIAAALISSDIKKLLQDIFASSSSSSSSGSGVLGSLVTAIFGSAGSHAGGGDVDSPTWVGEDGPELLVPKGSMSVYNQRQLAFGSGGGSVNFAPQYNVAITGAKDDAALREEFYSFVVRKTEKDKADIYNTLGRNGVKVRR